MRTTRGTGELFVPFGIPPTDAHLIDLPPEEIRPKPARRRRPGDEVTLRATCRPEKAPDVTNYRLLFRSTLRLLCFAFGALTIHEAHARLHDRFA